MTDKELNTGEAVAELALEQMAVGDASSLRVHWLTDGYPPVGTKLYTHPVKELTISRNEAVDAWNKEFNRRPITADYIPAFAKAILRKAGA